MHNVSSYRESINRVLTAISGLSARTYSWGGDGGRFFLTVGTFGVAPEPFLPLRYQSSVPLATGTSTSSSLESEEESSERSEEDMASACGPRLKSRKFGGKGANSGLEFLL